MTISSSMTTFPTRRTGLLPGLWRRSPSLIIGGAILLFFAVLAFASPFLLPNDPLTSFPAHMLEAPSAGFWFGTDANGMDILSRTATGSLYGFGIAIPVVLISLLVGVPLGLLAGYRGGLLDELLMRLVDGLRVFPSMILVLAVVAAAGRSLFAIVLVIGLLEAPVFVRLVRSEVLVLRSSNFVEAAVAAGNSTWRILFVHLLPNAIQGTTAQMAIRAAWAIRVSATLAFLGIGIQPPTPEWGAMIRQGSEYMVTGQWWVALFPGLALVLMVLSLNMFGDGLQEVLDPRLKSRSA